MRSWLALVSVCVAAAAGASELPKARAQVSALDFKSAAKTLERVRLETGLARGDVLAFYELAGIVAATLHDARGSQAAFRLLLALNPEHRLKGRLAPRVATPFYEAKASVAEHGALSVQRRSPRIEAGRVMSVGFTVSREGPPVKVATVHYREDRGAWQTVPLGPEGTIATDATRVEAWVQLFGANSWELETLGSERAPVVFEALPTPPTAEAQPSAALVPPAAPPEPPPATTFSPTELERVPRVKYRVAAWTLLGVGVAALGTATVLGAVAAGERQRFSAAATDSQGNVTSLTRQGALELDASVRLHATQADALFVSAGALAAGGAGLWIAGAMAPGPGGGSAAVVVGGAFP